jgi:hypothetical protein
MDAGNIMELGKIMDASNDKANKNQQGSSGAFVEYLVCNLKVTACIQIFFLYTAGKFQWDGKRSRNSGIYGKNFFCFMYEFSLRHPVWVAKINVTPCNSVGLKQKYLLTFLKSPHVLVKIQNEKNWKT